MACMRSEKEKKEIIEEWYMQGIEAGFTPKQLDFLKDYFAFFSDVPKDISDLF